VRDKSALNFKIYAVYICIILGLVCIDVKNDIAFVAVGFGNLTEKKAVFDVHAEAILGQRKGLSPEVQPFAILKMKN
tara:strand:+ start:1345 stop:1575 length:231 start_codon:yes stop_codon:yes gene_type:complete